MYYFMKGKSNKDTFQYMVGDWYGEGMKSIESRSAILRNATSFLGENTTLNIETIADLGSGDGTMVEAMKLDYSYVKGYEIREEMVESSKAFDNIVQYDILNPLSESFDVVFANVLMYFSDEELEGFFEANKENFKAIAILYRYGFVLSDEARINFLTANYFEKLAERHGLIFIDDPDSNLCYMVHQEYLKND